MENIGICYGHSIYLIQIWYGHSIYLIQIWYGHLVYFVVIWFIFSHFWYGVPRKSGNLDVWALFALLIFVVRAARTEGNQFNKNLQTSTLKSRLVCQTPFRLISSQRCIVFYVMLRGVDFMKLYFGCV
jgi:hypothetical protein